MWCPSLNQCQDSFSASPSCQSSCSKGITAGQVVLIVLVGIAAVGVGILGTGKLTTNTLPNSNQFYGISCIGQSDTTTKYCGENSTKSEGYNSPTSQDPVPTIQRYLQNFLSCSCILPAHCPTIVNSVCKNTKVYSLHDNNRFPVERGDCFFFPWTEIKTPKVESTANQSNGNSINWSSFCHTKHFILIA